MTAGKQRKRAARREGMEQAREQWRDVEFGVALEEVRQGHGSRMRLRWLIDSDPGVALLSVERVRQVIDAVECEYVLALREEGWSWEELGWALGITGEAARRRHVELEERYRTGVRE